MYKYILCFCSETDEVVLNQLGDVKDEISNIVGLSEIKSQLSDIVKKIFNAEKRATLGYSVIPPKPFHIVFIGNSGTGKLLVLPQS